MSNRLKFNFVLANPINRLDPSGHDDQSDKAQQQMEEDRKKVQEMSRRQSGMFSESSTTTENRDANGHQYSERTSADGRKIYYSNDPNAQLPKEQLPAEPQSTTPAPANKDEQQPDDDPSSADRTNAEKEIADKYNGGDQDTSNPTQPKQNEAPAKDDKTQPQQQPNQPAQQPNQPAQPPQQQNQAPPKVNPPPQKPATTPNQTPAPGNNNERARDSDRDIQQRLDREEVEQQDKAKQKEQEKAQSPLSGASGGDLASMMKNVRDEQYRLAHETPEQQAADLAQVKKLRGENDAILQKLPDIAEVNSRIAEKVSNGMSPGAARDTVLWAIAKEFADNFERRSGQALSNIERAIWYQQIVVHYRNGPHAAVAGKEATEGGVSLNGFQNSVSAGLQLTGNAALIIAAAPTAITPQGAVFEGILFDYALSAERQVLRGEPSETFLKDADRDMLMFGAMGTPGPMEPEPMDEGAPTAESTTPGTGAGPMRADATFPNENANWNLKSTKTWGHTWTEHGEGRSVTELTDRARTTGDPQGQWLNDQAAADYVKQYWTQGALGTNANGAVVNNVIPLRPGMGRIINPDGSIEAATKAIVIFRPDGGIRTMYPLK